MILGRKWAAPIWPPVKEGANVVKSVSRSFENKWWPKVNRQGESYLCNWRNVSFQDVLGEDFLTRQKGDEIALMGTGKNSSLFFYFLSRTFSFVFVNNMIGLFRLLPITRECSLHMGVGSNPQRRQGSHSNVLHQISEYFSQAWFECWQVLKLYCRVQPNICMLGSSSNQSSNSLAELFGGLLSYCPVGIFQWFWKLFLQKRHLYLQLWIPNSTFEYSKNIFQPWKNIYACKWNF